MGRRRRKLEGGDGWTVVRECPRCRRAESECVCTSAENAPDSRAIIRLRLEKRCGNPATVLAASGWRFEELKELIRELKNTCATGGSVSPDKTLRSGAPGGRALEAILQGDHRDRVRAVLRERGFDVRG